MGRFCILLFITLCTLFASGSNKAKDGYNIRITIKGLKDSNLIIAFHYGDRQVVKDTVKMDSRGTAEFIGSEPLPHGIYLVVLPDKRYFEMVVAEQHFAIETESDDLTGRMKVKSSLENELFMDYIRYINPRGKKADSLRKEMGKVKDSKDSTEAIRAVLRQTDTEVSDFKRDFSVKHKGTFVAKILKAMTDVEIPEPPKRDDGKVDSFFKYNYYKEHFFDNIDFSEEGLLRTPIYHNKLKQYIETFTPQIPDSINKAADFVIEKARASRELFKYTVWWITNTYETSHIMGMDAVFVHLAEKYYTYAQAYWVDSATMQKIQSRVKLLKPLLIGKVAPELKMPDTAGRIRSLHGVQAKYTLLVFWDPDCGHCKKEIPELFKTYSKLKPKGLEGYAVCTEVEYDKWKKFIDDFNMDWLNVWDPTYRSNYRDLYDISSTPKIFLLNEKKEIIAKQIEHKQVEEMMERLTEKEEKKNDLNNRQ